MTRASYASATAIEMMAPYDKLKSLPSAVEFLKPEITFEPLNRTAYERSDHEAARQLNEARAILLQSIQPAA
jgi:hypothetical protein